MRYVISDIHGCKKEYLKLLEKINFSDEDHLFIKKLGFYLLNFESEDEKWDFRSWVKDGGLPTMNSFLELETDEKQKIYEYIENAKWYEELEHEGKKHILAHAGISSFDEDKPLNQYDCLDFIYGRMNYAKRYYSDENTYIISGHTPTPVIRADGKPEVLINENHVAIDCGCVYGGRLAAYCIETGETVKLLERLQYNMFPIETR